MALSIGVKQGSKILVGEHQLEVHSITSSNDIAVSIDGGRQIVISPYAKTQVLPDVYLRSGIGSARNTKRLAFEAPRNIPIARQQTSGLGEAFKSHAASDEQSRNGRRSEIDEACTTATDVALLAPVPIEHLKDGQITAKREGRVAYGSRAWELFRNLDAVRNGSEVDAYIYASHQGGEVDFEVTWKAKYVGHMESEIGAHPHGMRYRPPSTANYSSDNSGYWAVFWEIKDLHQLPSTTVL
ncbi:MAG: hypothetical protein ACJ746_14105 [Bryobacteraceae bacterium]